MYACTARGVARRKKPRSLECQAGYFGLYSVGDGKSLEGLSKGDDPNLSLQKDHSEALAWRWIKESEWDWKTAGLFQSSKQDMRGRENQHDFTVDWM